jgi:hypothetical protein
MYAPNAYVRATAVPPGYAKAITPRINAKMPRQRKVGHVFEIDVAID